MNYRDALEQDLMTFLGQCCFIVVKIQEENREILKQKAKYKRFK